MVGGDNGKEIGALVVGIDNCNGGDSGEGGCSGGNNNDTIGDAAIEEANVTSLPISKRFFLDICAGVDDQIVVKLRYRSVDILPTWMEKGSPTSGMIRPMTFVLRLRMLLAARLEV